MGRNHRRYRDRHADRGFSHRRTHRRGGGFARSFFNHRKRPTAPADRGSGGSVPGNERLTSRARPHGGSGNRRQDNENRGLGGGRLSRAGGRGKPLFSGR